MTRGGGEPQPVKRLAAKLRAQLISRGLETPVRTRPKRIDKVDHWHVEARGVRVRLGPDFPGRWRLHLSWTFAPIPASDELPVLQSSAGLYAAGVPALGGDDEERCLVRYDVDNAMPGPHLAPLGPHLNVYQPGKLTDRIHYALPGIDARAWAVADVLDVLLSDRLAEDLKGRLD